LLGRVTRVLALLRQRQTSPTAEQSP
jgi:hypothetical protein